MKTSEERIKSYTDESEKTETELEKDTAIDFVFDNPEITSYIRINYSFPEYEGKELKPGHRLLFIIPEEFRSRIIRDVILRHRKDSKYAVDINPADRHDPHGAYSRVELHDDRADTWVSWRDPRGYDSDKFAEPRSAHNPEEEVLHDWIATAGPIQADSIRVTNVGNHPEFSTSQIHGLEVVFYPEFKAVNFREIIYTLGTKFIDLEKGELLPSYGGGSFNEGRYLGAIPLNQVRSSLYELGEDPGPEAKIEDGKLIIKLDSGKKLLQVEVAIGDTEHLNYINPKTNRHMRLGYAKLKMGIKRAKTQNIEWFVNNVNVPPQGVIAGGPHLEKQNIEPGDELILESQADTSYIMGWRLTYK